jgi:hypothetical protein
MVESVEAFGHRPALRSREAVAAGGAKFLRRAVCIAAKTAIFAIYIAALIWLLSWLFQIHLCAHGDMAVCDRLLKIEANE